MQRWCLFFKIRLDRKIRFLGNEISELLQMQDQFQIAFSAVFWSSYLYLLPLIFSKRLRSCNACADGYQESHPESVYDVVDGAANDTTSERGSFISFVNPNDLEENTVSFCFTFGFLSGIREYCKFLFYLRVFVRDGPEILLLTLSEFK